MRTDRPESRNVFYGSGVGGENRRKEHFLGITPAHQNRAGNFAGFAVLPESTEESTEIGESSVIGD
jgi:hypothetical protein